MTPEEKTKELLGRYRENAVGLSSKTSNIKQCAIICVEEILQILSVKYNEDMGSRADDKFLLLEVQFWNQVLTILKQP